MRLPVNQLMPLIGRRTLHFSTSRWLDFLSILPLAESFRTQIVVTRHQLSSLTEAVCSEFFSLFRK